MGNYKIMSENYYLERIKSTYELFEIAINDEDSSVRKSAAKLIQDQNLLYKILINENQWSLKVSIAKRITDEEILYSIALNCKEEETRKVAIEKITDEEKLMYLFGVESSRKIKIQIIQKLSKENIEKIRSDDWYIKRVCKDILKPQINVPFSKK